MAEAKYLAFDLGAESGRAVLGCFDGETLRLEDVHRFPNVAVRVVDTLQWDALRLFGDIKRGLQLAAASAGPGLDGVGIDTWGVDFGLLGRGGVLLGNPRHYRNRANDGMMEVAFASVPRDSLFARTGIQFMQFNTLFQLLALRREQSPLLDAAETLLMMPDLFNFWLTGVRATEFSIATTTQMFDPTRGGWSEQTLHELGLPTEILTDIVPTATTIGALRRDIADEAGCCAVPVIAPAEHDTGSAVVAVPSSGPGTAYISSGTWSLMGIESDRPIITDVTRRVNFTNEGGACGTFRILKNIMGLWLVQECRRAWMRRGSEFSYAELAERAAAAPDFGPQIEPDDVSFLAPADMPHEIAAFCRRTDQNAPTDTGGYVRCCLESLALKYRWVLERLEEIRGSRIDTIHIVGGGTQNRLLCQLAADATDRRIVAGPVEATAAGNVLMQAMGRKHINSLADARAIVRSSFELHTYEPAAARERWDTAYARFLAIRERIGKTD